MSAPSCQIVVEAGPKTPELSKKELLQALLALQRGDARVRLPDGLAGLDGKIAESFNALAQTQPSFMQLRGANAPGQEVDWLKTHLAKLSRMLQGQKDLQTVGKLIFSELALVVPAEHASFYLVENSTSEPHLSLLACYSCSSAVKEFPQNYRIGEGRVGQCASTKKVILMGPVGGGGSPDSTESPTPMAIMVLPVVFEQEVKGVIELVSKKAFNSADQELLEELCESLGSVLHTIENDRRTQELLKQSQALARELQQTNEALQEKAKLLADQKSEVENKNREIEQARQSLREKASQLAQTSKFKSEFLANMSHELRTPLNSMLLLARQLLENHEQTMTEKQLEFARVIHSAGDELLRLINDILDLSKIESGTVTVDMGELQFWELQEFVERSFRLVAKSRNLDFTVQLDPALPAAMLTDGRRLEQILKNLLANAFKFTEEGGVHAQLRPAASGWSSENLTLSRAQSVVAFSVADSGIGISADKQKLIFEAFQQGDGSTNRRFGGTGLGLTISREIARLLGGEIQVRSAPGKGSVFTLYLPLRHPGTRPESTGRQAAPEELLVLGEKVVADDRDNIQAEDRVLLCIEDDYDFSACLIDMARQAGFKALATTHGDQGMELLRQYNPDAITLDLTLPDIDGWKVLGQLKEDPATRHIPIAVISGDEERARGLSQGAALHLVKPVPVPALKKAIARLKTLREPQQKHLLIVKPVEAERRKLVELAGREVCSTCVRGGQAALAALKERPFDCMVLDAVLPDMTGFHVLEEIGKLRLRDLPVIFYSKGNLSPKEQAQLHKLERKVLIKLVRSPERLLDQTALFLHLSTAQLAETERRIIQSLHASDITLSGKKVLIVDDDIRNLFALTSLMERHGMRIQTVENGKAAIEVMEKGPGIDVVLMDIMMPGLDGYDTIKILRKNHRFASVPIIAVTAKAMKEDRLKCLQAGASDYIPKPVDAPQLMSALRKWLHQ